MKIQPINNFRTSFTGSKIPVSAKLINESKKDNIEALKLASAFKKFEENIRTTMQTFIYMIKL